MLWCGALTNGVAAVNTLVAVLGANSIGMAPVYHWQLWEPAMPGCNHKGSGVLQWLIDTFSWLALPTDAREAHDHP